MNINEYQEKAAKTAIYPDVGNNIYYPALGLGGEAGEILNKVKKVMRDDANTLSDARREQLASELGDVLWYVAAFATELNTSLEEVAVANLEKLSARKASGKIQGSGDNR